MRKALFVFVITLLFSGCGPSVMKQPGASQRQGEGSPISDLQIAVNDQSMNVTWKRLDQGAISGYNIYISRRPLAAAFPGTLIDSSIKPYNLIPFPGDTDPEDGVEIFEATGLDNGVRYYVTVRIVYPDGTSSAPSAEVMAVCGPRGQIELPIRYQAAPDGYSFEKNDYTKANSVDNDLFFFSKDGHDYLTSPRRLDGFINDTRFQVLPFHGSFDEITSNLVDYKASAKDDQVEISVGDWVLARLNSGTSALLEVTALTGSGLERRVVLFFAYSAAKDELLF